MAERDPGSSDSEGEDPDYALHSEPPSGKASLSSLPVLLPDPVDPAVVETVTSYAEATSGMVPRLELPGSSKVDGSQGLSKMLGLVGKSLSTISMPVNINEPLDTMQRLCEELHYCHLLDQAASEPDAGKRLLYIAAFAVSGVGTTAFHSSKPFNPLLGQTYEFISPERGFRFIAEQVNILLCSILQCYVATDLIDHRLAIILLSPLHTRKAATGNFHRMHLPKQVFVVRT